MPISLRSLETPGPDYLVEPTPEGFAIVRRDRKARATFTALARRVLDAAGDTYVALPRSDGPDGYERVFIIPFEDRA